MIINDEVIKWEERVYYGSLTFKPENKQPESPFFELTKKIAKLLFDNKFTVISTEYESQVYKIAKLMIEKFHFINEDFTFLDGQAIESYIGDQTASPWNRQERAKEFVTQHKNEIRDKVVLIPSLSVEVSQDVALYMTDQFEKNGARGIIFSSEENKGYSFDKGLAANYYSKLIQFPTALFAPNHKKIKDDGN